jgi:hypothetical protein
MVEHNDLHREIVKAGWPVWIAITILDHCFLESKRILLLIFSVVGLDIFQLLFCEKLPFLIWQLVQLGKGVKYTESTEEQGQIDLPLLLHFTHEFLRFHVEHPYECIFANDVNFFAKKVQIIE